jgi:protocatechuate 3,4-dioxygenase, alpha subunit
MALIPTASQTAGPYVHLGLTSHGAVACLAGAEATGDRLRLTCRILDGEGVPVPDAVIEMWQANGDGKYQHPEDPQPTATVPTWRGFGRLPVGEDGVCAFETVKPGCVPGPGATRQAPHLNLAIFARGLLKQLNTRAYFAGDPANSEDPILALVQEERRATLMAQRDPSRPGGWNFEIRLGGEGETVFFDV